MKKSIPRLTLFIASLFVVHSFIAQQPIAVISEEAEISFDKSTHDYGQIEKSSNGECVFVFTNNGNKPLKITNAKGSCGCTVILYTLTHQFYWIPLYHGGAGGQIFNIGKSKAQMFGQGKSTNVTFDNVA